MSIFIYLLFRVKNKILSNPLPKNSPHSLSTFGDWGTSHHEHNHRKPLCQLVIQAWAARWVSESMSGEGISVNMFHVRALTCILTCKAGNSTAPVQTARFTETFTRTPRGGQLWAPASVTWSLFLQSVFSQKFNWHHTSFLLNFFSYFSLPHNLNLNYMLFYVNIVIIA